jgi:hypothetical protein
MADLNMLRKFILTALVALGVLGADQASADILSMAGEGGAALAVTPLAHVSHGRRHHGRQAMFRHFRHSRHDHPRLGLSGARLGLGRHRLASIDQRAFRAEATPSNQFVSFPSDGSAAPGAENRPLELHPLLAVAKRYIGRANFTHDGGAWCRDAVNVWLRQAGYHLANNSRRAIDALRLGHRVASPRPGDLVVMRHHVTIFAGWGGRGLVGLGGNQGHRVKYSHFSASGRCWLSCGPDKAAGWLRPRVSERSAGRS